MTAEQKACAACETPTGQLVDGVCLSCHHRNAWADVVTTEALLENLEAAVRDLVNGRVHPDDIRAVIDRCQRERAACAAPYNTMPATLAEMRAHEATARAEVRKMVEADDILAEVVRGLHGGAFHDLTTDVDAKVLRWGREHGVWTPGVAS